MESVVLKDLGVKEEDLFNFGKLQALFSRDLAAERRKTDECVRNIRALREAGFGTEDLKRQEIEYLISNAKGEAFYSMIGSSIQDTIKDITEEQADYWKVTHIQKIDEQLKVEQENLRKQAEELDKLLKEHVDKSRKESRLVIKPTPDDVKEKLNKNRLAQEKIKNTIAELKKLREEIRNYTVDDVKEYFRNACKESLKSVPEVKDEEDALSYISNVDNSPEFFDKMSTLADAYRENAKINEEISDTGLFIKDPTGHDVDCSANLVDTFTLMDGTVKTVEHPFFTSLDKTKDGNVKVSPGNYNKIIQEANDIHSIPEVIYTAEYLETARMLYNGSDTMCLYDRDLRFIALEKLFSAPNSPIHTDPDIGAKYEEFVQKVRKYSRTPDFLHAFGPKTKKLAVDIKALNVELVDAYRQWIKTQLSGFGMPEVENWLVTGKIDNVVLSPEEMSNSLIDRRGKTYTLSNSMQTAIVPHMQKRRELEESNKKIYDLIGIKEEDRDKYPIKPFAPGLKKSEVLNTILSRVVRKVEYKKKEKKLNDIKRPTELINKIDSMSEAELKAMKAVLASAGSEVPPTRSPISYSDSSVLDDPDAARAYIDDLIDKGPTLH